ncbi:hypothetical protein BH10CYA1_BH10CYA1_32250 [soil metagenome]
MDMVNATDRPAADSPSTLRDHSVSGNLLSDALGWTADNVGKPLVNSALLTPWNAIASTTNELTGHSKNNPFLTEAQLFEVPKAGFLSANWFAQGISGGLGAVAPYIIAGRATGGAMRLSGEALGVEGKAAEILQSRKIAQIAGAGIYDGMRDPGQGETRFGNALAGASMFGVFEYGNGFGRNLNFAGQIGKRAAIGFVGAEAGQTVSHLVSEQKLPTFDQYAQAGLSGAVLNIALPPTQHALLKAGDGISNSFSSRSQVNRSESNIGQSSLQVGEPVVRRTAAPDALTVKESVEPVKRTEPAVSDALPQANNNIPRPATLLAKGEGEGDIYDNGNGTVTKIYYDKSVDAAQKRAMYDRLEKVGVTVPKIFDHGTTPDGQPALVIEKVGDGDSLKWQLMSGELSGTDREGIRRQYYEMGDTLERNGLFVDWNLGNMRFENGKLYLLDPSFIKENQPISRDFVDMFGRGLGPRD